jgi:hypothetical protein
VSIESWVSGQRRSIELSIANGALTAKNSS